MVELLDAHPTAGLAVGGVGAIVEQVAPDTFLVEFVDDDGKTVAFETLASEDFAVRR